MWCNLLSAIRNSLYVFQIKFFNLIKVTSFPVNSLFDFFALSKSLRHKRQLCLKYKAHD